MALSKTEKVKILRYFNWAPDKVQKNDSVYYSNIIFRRLENLSEEVETEARNLLNRIIAIDQQLETVPTRLQASSIGRGKIELNPRERNELRSERLLVLQEIMVLLQMRFNPIYSGHSGW